MLFQNTQCVDAIGGGATAIYIFLLVVGHAVPTSHPTPPSHNSRNYQILYKKYELFLSPKITKTQIQLNNSGPKY